MIKHLFNHRTCSIMLKEKEVNARKPFPAKRAKTISDRAISDHIIKRRNHGENEHKTNLQEQLSSVTDFQMIAEVFKQLGDTTRIRIFWMLCHCEECVINIAAMLDMSSPAVSHHLRPLRNSGLITSRREGKEVYYQAADTPQSRLLHQMIEQVMEITCPK